MTKRPPATPQQSEDPPLGPGDASAVFAAFHAGRTGPMATLNGAEYAHIERELQRGVEAAQRDTLVPSKVFHERQKRGERLRLAQDALLALRAARTRFEQATSAPSGPTAPGGRLPERESPGAKRKPLSPRVTGGRG